MNPSFLSLEYFYFILKRHFKKYHSTFILFLLLKLSTFKERRLLSMSTKIISNQNLNSSQPLFYQCTHCFLLTTTFGALRSILIWPVPLKRKMLFGELFAFAIGVKIRLDNLCKNNQLAY
ncbi:hypothetical protein BpHYR1_019873 [Brachionus plicatilis]|uniref:Uncharacterized protein n=1 Tax=Brachionus plicatilis TaxID=10195 RepID=A0A3M7T8S9_BRAPC|nr:hypothetical protein BpHYR1_019873 [Brachionus plicatilis]